MFSCFPDDIKVDFIHIDNVIQAHLKVELQIKKLVLIKPDLQQIAVNHLLHLLFNSTLSSVSLNSLSSSILLKQLHQF